MRVSVNLRGSLAPVLINGGFGVEFSMVDSEEVAVEWNLCGMLEVPVVGSSSSR